MHLVCMSALHSMLEDLSQRTDDAHAKIKQLTSKVDKLIADSGYSPCCMILSLTGVVIVLLLLIILT